MRRLLAVALVVLGIAGLVLGRLGETVWAPSTERSASVSLEDPGAAVLIEPGVAYVGGHEGSVRVDAPADVHVIPVPRSDAEAYLGTARYTAITGVPDWSTLKTTVENPEGEATLPDPASADLWSTVVDSASPATVDIATLWREDGGAKPALPYNALLVVTDGTQAGASKVTITWPVDARNEWVPYAYAIGAALAVIGLILFALDFSAATARRRRAAEEIEEEARTADRSPAAVRAEPHDASGDVEAPTTVDEGTAAATPVGAAEAHDAETTGSAGAARPPETPFAATGRGRRRAALDSDQPTTDLSRHDEERGIDPEEDLTR